MVWLFDQFSTTLSYYEFHSPALMSYFYIIISGLCQHAFNFCFKVLKQVDVYQIATTGATIQLLLNQFYQLQSKQSFHPLSNIKYLVLRTIAGTISFICIQLGIKKLMITEYYSILYTTPLVVLVASRVFYNEWLSYYDYLGMVFAIAGAILVIKPPLIFELINPDKVVLDSSDKYYGYLYAFIVVISYTCTVFLLKMVPKQITEYQMLNYVSLGYLFISAAGQLVTVQVNKLSFAEYLILTLSAIFGVGFQNMQTKAIRLGDPGKLFIMRYLGLFYGFLTDNFYFEKSMDYYTICGALLIFLVSVVMFIKNACQNRVMDQKGQDQDQLLNSGKLQKQ